MWLGSGTYGKVIKVEDQVETEWVAIKISECRHDDAKSLKAEVELAQKVPRHANIARYDTCYRLLTEMGLSDFAIMKYYADGNLADLMKSRTLSDAELRELVRGILEGLKLLHRQRIVHRDFKPANILISRDNRGRLIPKIADFGLSKFVAEDEIDSSDFDLSDGRGTPAYKAPEQITGGTVSFNLDLWAFGVILYEMITGEKPFSGGAQSSEPTQRREMESKIVSVRLPNRLDTVAEPFQSMIRRCLVKDIRERVRKPDELLTLLEKPTTQKTAVKPIPAFASVGDCTDVFVPPALPKPEPRETKPIELEIALQPTLRVFQSVPSWLPWAVGAVVLLIGSYVWSSQSANKTADMGPTQNVATTDPPNPDYAGGKESAPPAQVQQAALVDPAGAAGVGRVKAGKSNADKAEAIQPKTASEKGDKMALKKQQVQQEYEALIDKGIAAINGSNDKVAAINFFKNAEQLAAANGLNTAKGNAAYTQYLEKGNRIYENDGFQGAMAWYRVAQSLRPTDEIKRKIRECEINLN